MRKALHFPQKTVNMLSYFKLRNSSKVHNEPSGGLFGPAAEYGAVLGFCAKTGANAPIERSDMPPQIGNSVSIDFTKEIRFN